MEIDIPEYIFTKIQRVDFPFNSKQGSVIIFGMDKLVSGEDDLSSKFDLSELDRLDDTDDKDRLSDIAKEFRASGMLWLQGVFSRDLLNQLKTAYLKEYAVLNEVDHPEVCQDVGDKDRNMYTVVKRPPFDHPDLHQSPLLFPVLRSILQDKMIIQSFGIVSASPGSRRQHLHVDHTELFEEAFGFGTFLPPYAITLVVPLLDLDEQTGTTAIWPGSHRNPANVPKDEENLTYEHAVLPKAKAGDCVMWDFRTWHCGTANLTQEERPLIYMTVSRRWFEDRCNYHRLNGRYPLLLSQDFMQGLDKDQKKLFQAASIFDGYGS